MTFFNLTGCFDPPQTERSDFSDKLSLTAYFFQLHWFTFPLFTPSLSESTFYSLLWFPAAVQHTHGEHQSHLSLSLTTTEQQSPESLSAYVLLRDNFLLASLRPQDVGLTANILCLDGIVWLFHSRKFSLNPFMEERYSKKHLEQEFSTICNLRPTSDCYFPR